MASRRLHLYCMKAEPQIDLEMKKVYKATIEIMAGAHAGEEGKVSKTWGQEENKIFYGETVVVQMKYDHVHGLIEVLSDSRCTDYIAETLGQTLLRKYWSSKLKNDASMDEVDKANHVLDTMANDVRVRSCAFSGSPFD